MYSHLLLLWMLLQGADPDAGRRMAADYFRAETARVAARAFAGVSTLADWQARRGRLRAEILEMLGLDPLPPRGDLRAKVAGTVETDRIVVEKIQFQSLPGLYVTGSLYRPKGLTAAAPAILYVCGHARVFENGIAYGNKAGYQHHPAWFAEHGYVALVIDSLDLGEIEGEHHGTFRRGWWWWPTRGYTPAGVETWNAVRALDYLETRREVDRTRIGVTGRSGGGAYTWFVAAVDDRPAAFVPVAGITDLQNHVVDGCIEGHCDCMYQVNTYAWDFATLAALAAPRPLLVANSDADRIFPLDGVVRVHAALRRIYGLYAEPAKLGLFISPGPHSDTQELQVAAFRWMNRWLKKDERPVDQVAEKRFTPEQLKVFERMPTDARNTRIHETFVSSVTPKVPASRADWDALAARLRTVLREKVFRNWPAARPVMPAGSIKVTGQGAGRSLQFSPDGSFRLRLRLGAQLPGGTGPLRVVVGEDHGAAGIVVEPRGTGATAWPAAADVHIRRRFLLLGQSLETMQVWDVRAALAALRTLPELKGRSFRLEARGPMALVALFAALFEEDVDALDLDEPPASLAAGSYPNALRFLDAPQALALTLPRAVSLRRADRSAWSWTVAAAGIAGGGIEFKQ